MMIVPCATPHAPLIGFHDPEPQVRSDVEGWLAAARFVEQFRPGPIHLPLEALREAEDIRRCRRGDGSRRHGVQWS
jgi:hypothetical protein